MIGAKLLGLDEAETIAFSLSDDEARNLSAALCDIHAEYDVGRIINRKLQLWINLVTVLAMVYLPRSRIVNAAIKVKAAQARERVQTRRPTIVQPSGPSIQFPAGT